MLWLRSVRAVLDIYKEEITIGGVLLGELRPVLLANAIAMSNPPQLAIEAYAESEDENKGPNETDTDTSLEEDTEADSTAVQYTLTRALEAFGVETEVESLRTSRFTREHDETPYKADAYEPYKADKDEDSVDLEPTTYDALFP